MDKCVFSEVLRRQYRYVSGSRWQGHLLFLTCFFNIIGEVKISVKCGRRSNQPYVLTIFICSYDSFFDCSKDAPYTRKAKFCYF